MLAKYRVQFTLLILIAILIATAVAIFWARGFKPDFKNRSIQRTGLIVASSIPTGANVYLDERLTSATDTNIAFLAPKTYKVKIEKPGYTTWEKDIEIKADLATEIKALLFPQAPEIKPLTITGASNPSLSPDGSKIVYGVVGSAGGLYLLPMSDRPFPFRQGSRILAKNQLGFDFSQALFTWSPDAKQVLVGFFDEKNQPTANLLIDSERTDQVLRDITGSLASTLDQWQQEINSRAQTAALTVPDSVKQATGEARQLEPTSLTAQSPNSLNYFPTGLVFSPDEEKILYQNKEGKYGVYDLKTKKQYQLPDLVDLIHISWYPDSNHLVIAQNPPAGGLISIIEADSTNKMTVYTGKYENGFVFAHPSATRLIILTSLTQSQGTAPNLYSINLK